ncbi:hydroxymethylglutaryl-CoA reductase, degradative [Streptococcus pseudoporcinus]|uniref:3-hydroxy-3-methylglutaryl coenzyme A reductase n=1 Tax=Streptococcus pseudoporcinus TaxID=361101 RepID=A0A4V6KZS3_9STRE|nr:hydroxymethylglutaryl-CoA reductase, degradative [Streptococcus pseudoporcinus]VTS13987.1 3-hydroxy-3-methylglutaryl-CoA reductase [Streptococcus pseudoporcinus]VUC66923.1 3-hydroxy-3-methylglutaryl-CoA reductase [Streptococcus pseudoporcinus]VUC97851.1 3-hydroxy-3-methylglutaryl-CoA reductase [Streptococcus pseudoporcinus]VUC98243.1 3-hydroxy-3-methylglutaryl-CoA reductase [Streptococcus pseudoporcinus]
MTSKPINWSGFSKKKPVDRMNLLKETGLIGDTALAHLEREDLLSLQTANQMAENVLGRFALPFSIVPDFLINQKTYHLPMVTEEPSVIAAATFAGKIIKRSGGFKTKVLNRQMIGQVALYDVPDKKEARTQILLAKNHLLEIANNAYPSIVKRGGGACDLHIEIKGGLLIVYLMVDTQEAMGANMVNTMMEALSKPLEDLAHGKTLMAILSNYATEALVRAECQVDLRFLSRNKVEAEELAKKIVLASDFAQIDTYRAATHNKGIFNGIDALVIATGNDWRAIEAGGHAYAAKDDSYRGLSTWSLDLPNHMLKGQLTMPMPIATKGGSIGLNPSVHVAYDLLEWPNAKELAQIVVSLGLAQNFAALKALTSKGIQAGHMKLQAKSLALLAGASEAELASLMPELLALKHLNLENTQTLLTRLRQR